MIPEVNFAGRQSRGARANQEDTYGFCLVETGACPTLLLALADGMGGHERGEIASEIAASSFIRGLNLHTGNLRQAMLEAFEIANARIRAENERRGGKPDEMGTTMVGMHLREDRLQWVSVGDSPLFLYRKGALLRLNQEHAAAVQTPGAPPKPMLMSALTGGAIRMIDAPLKPAILLPGDIILCASDGILSFDQDRLKGKIEILAELPAGELAEGLIAAVEGERRTSQDNVTVAIVKYQPAQPEQSPSPTAVPSNYAAPTA